VSWKTPITLVLLLLILLGAAYYGWQSVTAPAASDTTTPQTPTTKAPCTKHTHIRKGQRIRASHIVVNVYNAGSITGLAGATSSNLAAKGFRAGQVTDAPARIHATNVAILTKAVHSPVVRLVASQFKGPVVIRKDNLGPGIDVVVGDSFQAVDPRAKSFLVVRKKVHTCASTHGANS
jgi:LytR cell envelope-related transcriptional attenuator